ncbi:MAG: Macrolide export ATP-binding/permease protein MacB [Myxococcales bacterium]|nr:Macrolide export ATP-binding/permease protein MacB [Myxococcales bacterium]
MNMLHTLRVALRALLRNKMRSFLTTLGMIIGVMAVIVAVAIGEGAKAKVEEAFAAMGSNLLIVMPGSTSTGGARGGSGSQPTLTWDDMRAISDEVPSVRYVAPVLRSQAQVMSEDQNWTTSIQGTSPEYFLIRSWGVARGATIQQSDIEAGAKVVVVGQTVVDKLFGANSDPIGQVVRIKNVPFQVIGVLTKKGQSAMGQDYDDAVYVPYTTFGAKVQGGLKNYLNGILYIGANSNTDTARAETQITNLLRDRHHVQGTEDDFFIRNLTELANSQQEGTKTMTTLLNVIAAVSLLVGGIGIMNIMLVSVTERTREIGLRMAVGAKPRNILMQFLVEAMTLSTLGGMLGLLLGVIGSRVLASSLGWATLVRPDIVVAAVAFSAIVGIGFGLYPAYKASRLDPIDALRYE